ncbi:MAG TPA: helix-turn-helix domain-containing protein, partial [Solirubrobacteraceae bacterium]|nr:helix-turn-helix domain-containing protein [Solirubrobacteraceae bacterium]
MSGANPQPSPSERRRTPRLPAPERRELLLDAALEVAEERGFGATTIDAVARAGGVTRPVVYDLFGDRDGLLLAMIDRSAARALDAVAAAVPGDPAGHEPEAVLVDGVRAFLEAVVRDPATWRLVLLPPAGSPPALRERIAAGRAAVAARIAALLEWGLAARGGPAGLDHEVLAH